VQPRNPVSLANAPYDKHTQDTRKLLPWALSSLFCGVKKQRKMNCDSLFSEKEAKNGRRKKPSVEALIPFPDALPRIRKLENLLQILVDYFVYL
jgi:hypothetical protein